MAADNGESPKYHLVTRSDFDGLVCAVLLRELGLIGDIRFVHPKDMQDGKIEVGPQDITTNLPYVEGCHLAFDHHRSETLRVSAKANHIIEPEVQSAARVVYNYYGGKARFSTIPDDMMEAVDKCDAAQFSFGEILHPKGWILLNFLMDARTGLGRFRNFRISNYQLMMDLIVYCRDHGIQEILEHPDVKERVDLYTEHEVLLQEQIQRCATAYGNLVVLDLRNEEVIYAGNRFLIYALYPDCNISIHVLWGMKKQNTVFAVGKSIVDRSNDTDIGALMLHYGGGGHRNAGTCQVDNERARSVLEALVQALSVAQPASLQDQADGRDVPTEMNTHRPPRTRRWMAVGGLLLLMMAAAALYYLTISHS